MNLFLVVFVIIFLLVIFLPTGETKHQKEDKGNRLNKYATKGYNFDNQLAMSLYTFAIDKNNEKLLIFSAIPTNRKNEFLLNFEDIIGFEVTKNGETITKASLGAPIAGGILFGVGGMILGSILSNRKSKEKLKVDIVIQLNSFDNPIVKIPIVESNDSEITQKKNLEELDKLCVWFKLILDKNESKKQPAK